MDEIPILNLARVVRSKNSGPFELTFDIVFKDASCYQLAVACGIFTPELFARLYGVDVEDVLGVVFFEKANAVKATIVRPVVSGGLGETDVYGAQQHAPLLGITIPAQDKPMARVHSGESA
jgi:hypothetical protein